MMDDPAKDPQYAEAAVDSMRAQKDQVRERPAVETRLTGVHHLILGCRDMCKSIRAGFFPGSVLPVLRWVIL